MTKTTTWTILGIIGLAIIAFAVWRFMSPEEALAPAGEESTPQATVTPENDTDNSDPFVQEAPSEEETPAVEGESEVAISMTDSGFSPETVTVPVGTTVVFVNDGQAPHWPASDNHPSHTILSEFDANSGLSTGETYSYTFDEAGEWGFHDHLNAQFTGTIVVEE